MTISGNGIVTTRRSRYLAQSSSGCCATDPPNDICVKVTRPTLLTLPYPLLAEIFSLSQNPALVETCRLLRPLAQDPHVRAQYLQRKFADSLTSVDHGSFFVRLLLALPPVENPRAWKVFKNRKLLEHSLCYDIYLEMKRKEKSVQLRPDIWLTPGLVSGRGILLPWLQEVCDDFTWTPNVRHEATLLLDRYLSVKRTVSPDLLQTIAGACLSLIVKGEECSFYSRFPSRRIMAGISHCSTQALCDMELEIMKTLHWETLHFPCAETFVAYFVCMLRRHPLYAAPDSLQSPSPAPSHPPTPIPIRHQQHMLDFSSSSATSTDVSSLLARRTAFRPLDQHPDITASLTSTTTSSGVYEDARYRRALDQLERIMVFPYAIAGHAPSLMAAYALWKAEVTPQRLAVSVFERLTGYAAQSMEQLEQLSQKEWLMETHIVPAPPTKD